MEEGREFRRGDVFAGFRLRSRLGQGGSGDVWEAEELALGRRLVALKLLRPELARDALAQERFRRGAVAASRIRHPGIVAVYSYGVVDGQPFLAQELVEGGITLASLIQRQRQEARFDVAWFRKVAELVAEVADALACGHEAGVLHRDVKPENILIDREGRAKVADFGLARLEDEQPLSASGDVMGTLCYMSPTQVAGDVHHLDEGTDVFSLGATLYELLTLRRAFTGTSLEEIAHQIRNVDPEPARRLQPRVPAHLELIAAKALEKRATDRLQSMRQFSQELRLFLGGQPTRLRQSTVFARALKWGRRHPTTSVGSCVTLLALAAFLVAGSRLSARSARLALEHEVSDALYSIQLGNLDAARAAVARADALDEDDPRGHLILALGLAGRGRRSEVEQELALARARGFARDPAELESALEHACFALELMTRHDFALYPEAEAHIDRALALAPEMYSLELTRYHIRIAADDVQGAERALARYQAHVVSADSAFTMLTALQQEVRGETRAALETLLALRDTLAAQPSSLQELRWYRNAGRIAVNLGRFDDAEEWLRRAVLEDAEDCLSWEGLAAAALGRVQAGDLRESERALAKSLARRASECNPALENPLVILAALAIRELESTDPGLDPRALPAWEEARQALDRLGEHTAHSLQATKLEVSLQMVEARSAMLRGDYRAATSSYQSALQLDPGNGLVSRQLVEALWRLGRYKEGIVVARAALERLDREGSSEGSSTLLVWGLGNAGKDGDGSAFALFRARLQGDLENVDRLAAGDALNAAEFLADAPDELRDCEQALRLLDSRDFLALLGDRPEVRESIQLILKRCE